MTIPRIINELYRPFNSGTTGFVAIAFASNAAYNQLDSGRAAKGRGEIAELIASMCTSFRGARIMGILQAELANDELHRVPSADQCFRVELMWAGRYIRPLPGLDATIANGQDVVLPMRETVWIANGKFVRIDSSLQVAALV